MVKFSVSSLPSSSSPPPPYHLHAILALLLEIRNLDAPFVVAILLLLAQSLLGFHTLFPSQKLALFVNVTLVCAPVRIKKGFSTATIQGHQKVGAIVADPQGHLFLLEQFQILILPRHGFRRRRMMMMTASHDSVNTKIG